jgi:hypothetical protein
MKKLILQHWGGELNDLTKKSVEQFETYAEWVGADYKLLRDHAFSKMIPKEAPTQKMAMLSEEWDNYDVVVMVDPDMFIRGRLEDRLDIFEDETGYGVHMHVQQRLRREMNSRYPLKFDLNCAWWGGSCWRLPREFRQKMRSHISQQEIPFFATRKTHCDEGFMHRLATLANVKDGYFPDARWQFPSYGGDWGNVATDSQFIHIRNKSIVDGKIVKTPKEENYSNLVKQGIILE